MGLVYADITLINSGDFTNAKRGLISSEKVRQCNVRALVDTGAYMLTIGEELRDKLGLDFDSHADIELADGKRTKCELVGPVKIVFKTRTTTCLAVVLPGAAEVLLGAIPLEGMDVIIDQNKQELALPPDRLQIVRTIVKDVRMYSKTP